MIEIVPAILPDKFGDIATYAKRVAGLVSRVQIDIVDGRLAPYTTWPYIHDEEENFAKLVREEKGLPEWDTLEYELDMMVENPLDIFEQWIDAGISTLIPHREAADDDVLNTIMKGAHARGVGFGVAMLPSTSTETILRWSHDADFIQIMGSDTIGKQGTPLADKTLEKIADLRRAAPNCVIAIDIGVNLETAPRLIGRGATKLVAGSAIWKSDNIPETIKKLAGSS